MIKIPTKIFSKRFFYRKMSYNFLMKKIFEISFFIFKIFLCVMLTFIIIGIDFEFLILGKNDLQHIFYLFLSLVAIFSLWILSFRKMCLQLKIIFLILFAIYFFAPQFLPSVMNSFHKSSCLDEGGRWNSAHQRCEF